MFINTAFASDKSVHELICDRFSLSLTQEGGRGYEDRVKSHFKKCSEFYKSIYNARSEVLDLKLARLEIARINLSAKSSEMNSLNQIAHYGRGDQTYEIETTEKKNSLKIINMEVRGNYDFSGAVADYGANEKFPQVGGLIVRYIELNRSIFCNSTYIEYTSGERGFVTSAHCIFDSGKIKSGSLANFKIYLGANSSSPIDEYSIKSASCGDNESVDVTDPSQFKDECFLTTNEPIESNLKPLKRKSLTTKEIEQMRYLNEPIFLVGFHPARVGQFLPNNVEAWNYRTKQKCAVNRPPIGDEQTKFARVIFHSCGTRAQSSGAALVYYDINEKQFFYIGTHSGFGKGDYGNYAVSVSLDELEYLAY